MKVSRITSIMYRKSGFPRQDPTMVEEDYHDFGPRHSNTEGSSVKF